MGPLLAKTSLSETTRSQSPCSLPSLSENSTWERLAEASRSRSGFRAHLPTQRRGHCLVSVTYDHLLLQ